MKVIAEKNERLKTVYSLILSLGLLLFFISFFIGSEPFLFLLGLLFIGLSLYLLIDIKNTPANIITFNEIENKLYLPKNKTIHLKEVRFVAYRKARVKGFEYKWGEVHITVDYGVIKCKYVKDCEQAAKNLYALIEQYKEKELYGD